jgi:hypothetical protein
VGISVIAASACVALIIVITTKLHRYVKAQGNLSAMHVTSATLLSLIQRVIWNANVDYTSLLIMNGNRRPVIHVARESIGLDSTRNNLC